MSIPNVTLNDNINVKNKPLTVNHFTDHSNIKKQQQEDSFNVSGINKKKILMYSSICTALVTLAGIAIDFKFAEGKHLKKLWNKLTNKSVKQEVKLDVNSNSVKPEINHLPEPKKVSIIPEPSDKPISRTTNTDTPKVKSKPEPKKVSVIPEPSDKLKSKTTNNDKPEVKIQPESFNERNYIDSETLSPVKEKWQGKNLLERTIKTNDGIVTTSYKNGKVESICTKGDGCLKLDVYASDGKTVKETYFNNFGNLHITVENKKIIITGIRTEEQFSKAVKFSQKYSNMSLQELDNIYKDVLSGNPNKMSLFEFNILEAHLDELNITVPKITKSTSIPKHGHYNAINNDIRNVMSGEKPLNAIIDRKMIEGVNRRMAETLPPLEKDCIFYRGIAEKQIPQVIEGKIGDVVVPDKGFAYTSWNKHYAKEYGDGTILIIHTPKGAKISRCNANYGEALFPSGAEYRIISKAKTPADNTFKEGQWRIELEYILPQA